MHHDLASRILDLAERIAGAAFLTVDHAADADRLMAEAFDGGLFNDDPSLAFRIVRLRAQNRSDEHGVAETVLHCWLPGRGQQIPAPDEWTHSPAEWSHALREVARLIGRSSSVLPPKPDHALVYRRPAEYTRQRNEWQAAVNGLNGWRSDPAPQVPFIPTDNQREILKALDGKAMQKAALAHASGIDDRKLYRPGALPELRAAGLVEHRRGVGYFRPDAPPPLLSDTNSSPERRLL